MVHGAKDPFADDFFFDPFGLHTSPPEDDSSTLSPHPPPQVTRLTRSVEVKQDPPHPPPKLTRLIRPVEVRQDPPAVSLPPRLVVRFMAHEEVSSVAQTGAEREGSSEVYIEGHISAQVTSSDALRNLPFCLLASTPDDDKIQFQANNAYSYLATRPLPRNGMSLINIPKTELTPVQVGSYNLTEQVRHMPLLVERKVTILGNVVRVAVQVRTKLSNNGDLRDFTIAVAVPERVNSETVEITRGEGAFDELKRTIKWGVQDLPKGESFMVSAQAELWSSGTSDDQFNLKFPVLLRCHSHDDQISSVELRAVEADGFPSTVSFSTSFSFRLLHRLP